MVTTLNTVFSCSANFLNGRKCVFCGSFKVNKTARGYVKCNLCSKQKSLSKLRREIAIIKGFYQQQPAYRLAADLNLDVKVVHVFTSVCEKCCFIQQNWKVLNFPVRLSWMNPTLEVSAKVSADVGLLAKALYLACWSAMACLYQSR